MFYDVVIVGAGMAGSTLAYALSHIMQGKLKIALLESSLLGDAHPGFDARAIALSYGSVEGLKRFHLWQDFQSIATPISHIQVSEQGRLGLLDIHAKTYQVDALGYVIELAKAGKIFQEKLKACQNLTYYCPVTVEQLTQHQDKNVLKLSSGEQITTKLVVGADGTFSSIANMLGLSLTEKDFNQEAIITNVLTQEDAKGRAFERFTPNGPVAFLPLTLDKKDGYRQSVVWCLPPNKAQAMMGLDEEDFQSHLQQAFGWRLGHISYCGKRSHYPLLLRYREKIIKHRAVVIGNAAQTLHPIAGQGFNLGIRDVMALVESLEKNFNEGCDIGSYSMLANYAKQREIDRNATMGLTSNLVHIFSNQHLFMQSGRHVSLGLMKHFEALKYPVIKRAMGLVEY